MHETIPGDLEEFLFIFLTRGKVVVESVVVEGIEGVGPLKVRVAIQMTKLPVLSL